MHGGAALLQNGDGVAARERTSIGPIGRERIETIDHGQDASAERDLIAREPVGIAGAVPVFMMVTHNRHHGIREVHAGENIGTDLRVFFHGGVFGVGEPARLVQDVLGNRKLAKVVQQVAASMACSCPSSVHPRARASCRLADWTRRMCPCVT